MRICSFVAFIALVLLGTVSVPVYGQEVDQVQMPSTPMPALVQVIGQSDISLGPSRYPEFFDSQSDNPDCAALLKKPASQGGKSLAPLPGYNPSSPKYVLVAGLLINDFVIPAQFKNSSRLLITWTLRVIGSNPDTAYGINSSIDSRCSVWHGTSWQRFRGGEVSTKLFINDQVVGEVAKMTMPDAGTSSVFVPYPPPPPPVSSGSSMDPTISGSVLVSKDDFTNKQFPAHMKIEVRWYNDTSMKISSLAQQRNLVINIMPSTGVEK